MIEKHETRLGLSQSGSVGLNSTEFGEFWQAYPRKVGKQAAVRFWNKQVRAGAEPRTIINAAKAYGSSPNLPEKRYIPHPASWLMKGMFDDDLADVLPPQVNDVPLGSAEVEHLRAQLLESARVVAQLEERLDFELGIRRTLIGFLAENGINPPTGGGS